MRVLFVSSQALFARTRFGGAKRLYYLAKELERRTDLTIVCLDGAREIEGNQAAASEFQRMLTLSLPLPGMLTRAMEFLPGVTNVLARNRKSIETVLGQEKFDATLMAYPLALRFLDQAWPSSLGKLVFMDDDLLLEQYRKRMRKGSWIGRILSRFRYRQAVSFFGDRFSKVDTCVCISKGEESVLRNLFPGLKTRVLKYGLPLAEYPKLPPQGVTVLGFIGNYRHLPNLDALDWLLEDLFPFLTARFPEVRLVVAGRHLPEYLRKKCSANASVKIMGEVEDLAAFYGAINLFINPVREGRGLRTKAVEAAAFGRPILSTALGAEGLESMQIGLFEDKEGFLAAYQVLSNSDEYARAADVSRAAVEAEFSLSSLGDDLVSILGSSLQDSSPILPVRKV